MKKIILSALAVTTVTLMFSCQKQDEIVTPASRTTASQPTPNKLVTLPPVRIPFTLSDWFSTPLSTAKDGSLYGRHELTSPLPGSSDTDVKLAYVRMNTGGIGTADNSFTYSQLPAFLNTSGRDPVILSFDLATDLFEIFFHSAGVIPVILDPQEFKDCAYRYIVIAKADYDALNIDWSDYRKVALLLNFTP